MRFLFLTGYFLLIIAVKLIAQQPVIIIFHNYTLKYFSMRRWLMTMVDPDMLFSRLLRFIDFVLRQIEDHNLLCSSRLPYRIISSPTPRAITNDKPDDVNDVIKILFVNFNHSVCLGANWGILLLSCLPSELRFLMFTNFANGKNWFWSNSILL